MGVAQKEDVTNVTDDDYDPEDTTDYDLEEVIPEIVPDVPVPVMPPPPPPLEPEPAPARPCDDCDEDCGGLVVEPVPPPLPPTPTAPRPPHLRHIPSRLRLRLHDHPSLATVELVCRPVLSLADASLTGITVCTVVQ